MEGSENYSPEWTKGILNSVAPALSFTSRTAPTSALGPATYSGPGQVPDLVEAPPLDPDLDAIGDEALVKVALPP
jgi:hypothetical protein